MEAEASYDSKRMRDSPLGEISYLKIDSVAIRMASRHSCSRGFNEIGLFNGSRRIGLDLGGTWLLASN
jgi:hypothetical protein